MPKRRDPGVLTPEDLLEAGIDLPEPIRKAARRARGRKKPLPMEEVRRQAIRALETIHPLSQTDRRRVLEHALKLNEV